MIEANALIERKNSIKKLSNGFSLKDESLRIILERDETLV